MADITMCAGICTHDGVTLMSCPFAKRCYRHEAEANEYRQSYFAEPPQHDGMCEFYIPMRKELYDLHYGAE